jgi:hypothetical protein
LGETSTITVHTLKVTLHILLIILIRFGFCGRSRDGVSYDLLDFGRPDEKVTSEQVKNGMMGV